MGAVKVFILIISSFSIYFICSFITNEDNFILIKLIIIMNRHLILSINQISKQGNLCFILTKKAKF